MTADRALQDTAYPILSEWMRACFLGVRRRRSAIDFRCGMDIREHWQWLGGEGARS